MNPLPEFCSCGNAFVLRRRTRRDQALYFTCLHCDGPCAATDCDRCVILTIDRTDAPDGAL